MAATNRLFVNFNEGTLTNNPGTAGTSFQAGDFVSLPAVADPDFVTLVIDPENTQGLGREVVIVTAHTASSTTCTVTRAQEGTTARNWLSGTRYALALTADTVDDIKTTAEAHRLRHLATGVDPSNIDIQSAIAAAGDNTVNTAWTSGTGGNQLTSATYTPPAAWGDYALYVIARCNMNPSADVDARIWLRIDGTDNSAARVREANETAMSVTGILGGCTGTTPVILRGSREASPGGSWTAGSIQIIMWGEATS